MIFSELMLNARLLTSALFKRSFFSFPAILRKQRWPKSSDQRTSLAHKLHISQPRDRIERTAAYYIRTFHFSEVFRSSVHRSSFGYACAHFHHAAAKVTVEHHFWIKLHRVMVNRSVPNPKRILVLHDRAVWLKFRPAQSLCNVHGCFRDQKFDWSWITWLGLVINGSFPTYVVLMNHYLVGEKPYISTIWFTKISGLLHEQVDCQLKVCNGRDRKTAIWATFVMHVGRTIAMHRVYITAPKFTALHGEN